MYSDPCLRPFVDLDVIVPAEQVDIAIMALTAAGYRGREPLSAARRRVRRRTGYAAHLVHTDRRIPLDLHWAFSKRYFCARLPSELVWTRTGVIELGGKMVPVPGSQPLLLSLAIHRAKHRPFPWPKLKWIVDMDGFVRQRSDIDLGRVDRDVL